jgi:MinD-like ATPase involved in chromosome partitioning or flagellar assembly
MMGETNVLTDDEYGSDSVFLPAAQLRRRETVREVEADPWGVKAVTSVAPEVVAPTRPDGPALLSALVPPATNTDHADPATWGFRGRVNAALRMRLRPGRAEVEHRGMVAALKQTYDAPPLIMVANPKGGAGKTITSLMLAYTFGLYRGGAVAWDNSDARGSLAVRAEGAGDEAQPSVWDVLENARALVSADADSAALDAFLRPQPNTFAKVLASDTAVGETRIVGWEDCEALLAVLRRHEKFLVMDTGNVDRSEAFLWSVAHATQLVVPVSPLRDHTHAAVAMLEDVRRRGPEGERLAASAVAVVAARPGARLASSAWSVDEALTQAGVSRIVRVPFDPVLAGGERVVYPHLSESTRRAWVRVASVVAGAIEGKE